MATRRVRLADVAAATGLSRTTISLVLNGRARSIPQETQDRVTRAAQALGYRANATARALATGRTHRLGVVLEIPEYFSLNNAYFVELLSGAAMGALEHDYNLLLYSAHHPDWRALHADILSGGADSVLVVGRDTSDELTLALLESGFPTVCVSYEVDHPRCWSVDCDNEMGGRLAAEHLLAVGHRQIAYLTPHPNASWAQARQRGALSAVLAAGLPAGSLRVRAWEKLGPREIGWVAEAHAFISDGTWRPTAVIFADEEPARTFVERLPEYGLRVPEDLAVVSYNSTEISCRTRPPLTSVWQPLREIGERAADVAIALASGKPLRDRTIRLPVRLDVRASTAAGVPV